MELRSHADSKQAAITSVLQSELSPVPTVLLRLESPLLWHRQFFIIFIKAIVSSFPVIEFHLNVLICRSEEKLARLEVVTSFKARNNPIKAFAAKNQIKIYDWADLLLNENRHICREFDLGLVVSFGHLIPEAIINSFKKLISCQPSSNLLLIVHTFSGMLNVHASLLPKYRGASPIVYAIRNGDKETGVSIMRIKPKKFDVGEILTTQKVLIPDDVMMPELHDHLSSIGADLLVDCISDLSRLRPIEQDNSKASYGT